MVKRSRKNLSVMTRVFLARYAALHRTSCCDVSCLAVACLPSLQPCMWPIWSDRRRSAGIQPSPVVQRRTLLPPRMRKEGLWRKGRKEGMIAIANAVARLEAEDSPVATRMTRRRVIRRRRFNGRLDRPPRFFPAGHMRCSSEHDQVSTRCGVGCFVLLQLKREKY